MRIKAISGVGGKGPACFLAEIGAARFLLDLGEGPAPGVFPDVSGVGTVDAILVSHGHADHIGGLHLAEQLGNPPIYATAMTRAFAGHKRLAQAHDLPLVGRIEVAGVSIETGRAGHAAGAVWMRLGGKKGLLYTGDLCAESLLYPLDPPPPAETMIADASYGNYDQSIPPSVADLIACAKQGPLLLPLPPTGRGVEIAVLLHEAGLPLSLCRQHRHVAMLMRDAAPGTLTPDGPQRLSEMLAYAAPLEDDSVADGVMIAANGGATGGTAKILFDRFLSDPGIRILFTGHVETGTPASEAIASDKAQFLRWNVHPRLRDLAWLRDLVKPTETVLAFCPAEAAEAVAESLRLG